MKIKLLKIILVLVTCNALAEDLRIEYAAGKELTKLADPAIIESSGLAVSRIKPGVFWTHNDSGDKARIFAFDKTGKALATISISKVFAWDWEDMASFKLKNKPMLIIGDVGDNAPIRKNCTLYVSPDPKLNGRTMKKGKVRPVVQILFKYEDGAQNCESIAVDPSDQTIYLISKEGGTTCQVYALPWPKRKKSKTVHIAKIIAKLSIPTTTAMDISPDGLRAIVLTYGPAYEYVRTKNQTWADAFKKPGRMIKMPARAQGESICYGADGKTLYLTSECAGKNSKNPSPLLEIPVLKK